MNLSMIAFGPRYFSSGADGTKLLLSLITTLLDIFNAF